MSGDDPEGCWPRRSRTPRDHLRPGSARAFWIETPRLKVSFSARPQIRSASFKEDHTGPCSEIKKRIREHFTRKRTETIRRKVRKSLRFGPGSDLSRCSLRCPSLLSSCPRARLSPAHRWPLLSQQLPVPPRPCKNKITGARRWGDGSLFQMQGCQGPGGGALHGLEVLGKPRWPSCPRERHLSNPRALGSLQPAGRGPVPGSLDEKPPGSGKQQPSPAHGVALMGGSSSLCPSGPGQHFCRTWGGPAAFPPGNGVGPQILAVGLHCFSLPSTLPLANPHGHPHGFWERSPRSHDRYLCPPRPLTSAKDTRLSLEGTWGHSWTTESCYAFQSEASMWSRPYALCVL